jgi:hypothetical protein
MRAARFPQDNGVPDEGNPRRASGILTFAAPDGSRGPKSGSLERAERSLSAVGLWRQRRRRFMANLDKTYTAAATDDPKDGGDDRRAAEDVEQTEQRVIAPRLATRSSS